MTDIFTPEVRSRVMASIRARDTGPEMVVRRMTHALGYRFRLYRRDLPGTPDLVFPGLRAVIFVDGCFWHRHACPLGAKMPATRTEWWRAKFAANVRRCAASRSALEDDGWSVLTVWECELRDVDATRGRIAGFLAAARRAANEEKSVSAKRKAG